MIRRLLSLSLALVFLILCASSALAAGPVEKITLRKSAVSVPVGKKVSVTAIVEPKAAGNKKLAWTSSDEKVAVVINGQITGKAVGTAVVTASAQDGSGVTASVQVTVVNPVTKILPDEPRLILQPGVAWEILWDVQPADATNKTVAWSSSNERIATVNESGVIYAHANGYCTITGSAEDGSGVKASIYLQVKSHDIVILEPGPVEVEFGTEETNVPLDITKDGKTASKTAKRKFRTANGCVITPSDKVLLPVKAGSDSISLVYIESKKVAKTDKYTVFVSRAAVGEGTTVLPEGEEKEILLLGIPWGSSYPKVNEILTDRGRAVKQISERNDYLRATLGSGVVFGSFEAFNAALNFSYRPGDRYYMVRNNLFRGDLYFDPDTPFDTLAQAVRNVYDLDEGERDGEDLVWKRGSVTVTLAPKAKFILLEILWNGEVSEAVEAENAEAATREEAAEAEGDTAQPVETPVVLYDDSAETDDAN